MQFSFLPHRGAQNTYIVNTGLYICVLSHSFPLFLFFSHLGLHITHKHIISVLIFTVSVYNQFTQPSDNCEIYLIASFSLLSQGEICLCTSRIFVERSIYPEFLARFVEAARRWKTGVPSDPSNDNGALISKEHLQKV